MYFILVVFNKISLTGFYWLELYGYERFFRLNLETGMGKIGMENETCKLGGVPGWILGTLG
jgi:hypothetical protein